MEIRATIGRKRMSPSRPREGRKWPLTAESPPAYRGRCMIQLNAIALKMV